MCRAHNSFNTEAQLENNTGSYLNENIILCYVFQKCKVNKRI